MTGTYVDTTGKRGTWDFTRNGDIASSAPSFDCGKAKTAIEELICKDSLLAGQERQMAAVYKSVLNTLPEQDKPAFRHDHLKWFKSYTRTCNTVFATQGETGLASCVSRNLTTHTRELQARTP
jgi:uncharacterized protein YecT (DUF1311 family)